MNSDNSSSSSTKSKNHIVNVASNSNTKIDRKILTMASPNTINDQLNERPISPTNGITSPINNNKTNSSTSTPTTPINTNTSSTSTSTPTSTTTTTTTTSNILPKTMRFEISLKKLNGTVDYKELVKGYIQDQNKNKISSSFYNLKGAPNNLRESFEIEKELTTMTVPKNRLTEVIDKIERISTLGSAINYTENGSPNSEDQYDDNDSFIDDDQEMEFNDDLETTLGGFFVNQGGVVHKERDYDEEDENGSGWDFDEYETSNHHHHNHSNDDDDDGSDNENFEYTETTTTTSTPNNPKKRKIVDVDPSTVNKKPKPQVVNLLDINSPEIESLLVKLEDEIKSYQANKEDLKLLPRKSATLLAQLYEKLRRTNTQGHLPGPPLIRLSNLWGIKDKTIRGHLKRAWEEKGEKEVKKADNSIERLNALIKQLRDVVVREFDEQVAATSSDQEPPKEYCFSREAREIVFEIVKLNKEIIDTKNSMETVQAEKFGKQATLIVEKTSRISLYKKIVERCENKISSKSLSTAYTSVRSAERKKEKKLEDAKAAQENNNNNSNSNNNNNNNNNNSGGSISSTTATIGSSSSNNGGSSSKNKSTSNNATTTTTSTSNSGSNKEMAPPAYVLITNSSSSSSKSDKDRSDKDRSSKERSSSDKDRSDRHHHHKSSSSGDKDRSHRSSTDKDRSHRSSTDRDRSERTSTIGSTPSSSGIVEKDKPRESSERRDKDKSRDRSSDKDRSERTSTSGSGSSGDKEKSRDRISDKDRSERKSSSGSSSSNVNNSSGSSNKHSHHSSSSSSSSSRGNETEKERQIRKEKERQRRREKEREREQQALTGGNKVDSDIMKDIISHKKTNQ